MQSNARFSHLCGTKVDMLLEVFLVKMHRYPTSQRSESELVGKADDDLDKLGNMTKVDSADGVLSRVNVRAAVIKG